MGVIEIVLVIAILGLACLLVINYFFSKKKVLNQAFYQKHWLRISKYLDDNQKYALAIIEADKLLDRAFKDNNLKGKTTGERLASAGKYLSQKDLVWKAHKLRNNLVHEMEVALTFNQTKSALTIFEVALKDMGAL